MKKLIISICVIFVMLSMAAGYVTIKLINRPQIRPFEGVDTDSVTKIQINSVGKTIITKDKSQILDIMCYLKSLKLYKRSNGNVPNTSPDAWIIVIDENGLVKNIDIYGGVARISPDGQDGYTVPTSLYHDLDELCKKY